MTALSPAPALAVSGTSIGAVSVGGLLTLFGLGVLAAMIRLIVKRSRFRSRGIRTRGTVVEHVVNHGQGEVSTTVTPIVEFRTRKGQLVRGKNIVSTNGGAWIGASVSLYYRPDNVSEIDIETMGNGCAYFGLTVACALMLLIGAVFLLGGIASL